MTNEHEHTSDILDAAIRALRRTPVRLDTLPGLMRDATAVLRRASMETSARSARVTDQTREMDVHGLREAPRVRRPSARARRRFLAATISIAVAVAAVAILLIPIPAPTLSWAEVVTALQSQHWIRGSVDSPNGKKASMWLSPAQGIWAFKPNDTAYFYDGREKIKYEYLGEGQPITKLPLGQDDIQNVLPIAALSHDESDVGPWIFGTEKIVEQHRREFTEHGRKWVEFQLVLGRGEMNHVTLRVDPDTKLPVHFVATSSQDKSKSQEMDFDYPADGPVDIYALGVPRNTPIDNRVPSKEALRVLENVAASRARIGDFRLIVGQSSKFASSIIYRKGNRWRVDSWRPDPAIEDRDNAREWSFRLDRELDGGGTIPVFVCDGNAVWENSNVDNPKAPKWTPSKDTAPQDLMSGEGNGDLRLAPGGKFASLLFPELTPKSHWTFEFDSQPKDAPGCVLIKRSALQSFPKNTRGHEWYYLDSQKGYAVVRAELFSLPDGQPGSPKASERHQAIILGKFQQSPQGVWFPTLIHDTRPVVKAFDPREKGIPHDTRTFHYYFDFNAKLPDSLFAIGGADTPK